MTRRHKPSTTLRAAAIAAVVVFAGGCSMDDVELNGGVFNALGVGANQPKAETPKLAARPGIVVPPDITRLPPPGQPAEAQAADIAALVDDPDRKTQVNQAELERQQAEYCEKNYEKAKALGDNNADLATGPLGPCRASVLTAVKKWNGGEPLLQAGQ
jgi:hypothetical protein